MAELAAELRWPDVFVEDGDELGTLTPGGDASIFAIHEAIVQPMFYRSVASVIGDGIAFRRWPRAPRFPA